MMIETTEPAEASLAKRIEELGREYQQALARRQEALQLAQSHGETAIRIQGAIQELERWRQQIWGGQQGEDHGGA